MDLASGLLDVVLHLVDRLLAGLLALLFLGPALGFDLAILGDVAEHLFDVTCGLAHGRGLPGGGAGEPWATGPQRVRATAARPSREASAGRGRGWREAGRAPFWAAVGRVFGTNLPLLCGRRHHQLRPDTHPERQTAVGPPPSCRRPTSAAHRENRRAPLAHGQGVFGGAGQDCAGAGRGEQEAGGGAGLAATLLGLHQRHGHLLGEEKFEG